MIFVLALEMIILNAIFKWTYLEFEYYIYLFEIKVIERKVVFEKKKYFKEK